MYCQLETGQPPQSLPQLSSLWQFVPIIGHKLVQGWKEWIVCVLWSPKSTYSVLLDPHTSITFSPIRWQPNTHPCRTKSHPSLSFWCWVCGDHQMKIKRTVGSRLCLCPHLSSWYGPRDLFAMTSCGERYWLNAVRVINHWKKFWDLLCCRDIVIIY